MKYPPQKAFTHIVYISVLRNRHLELHSFATRPNCLELDLFCLIIRSCGIFSLIKTKEVEGC